MDEKTVAMTALPFEPEDIAVMKSRLNKALVDKYNSIDVIRKGLTRPGELRKHVFDFEEGVRVIVSIDTDENNEWFHHVSVSIIHHPDEGMGYVHSKMYKQVQEAIEGGMSGMDIMMAIAYVTCKKIGVTPLKFLCCTQFVLHFRWEKA